MKRARAREKVGQIFRQRDGFSEAKTKLKKSAVAHGNGNSDASIWGVFAIDYRTMHMYTGVRTMNRQVCPVETDNLITSPAAFISISRKHALSPSRLRPPGDNALPRVWPPVTRVASMPAMRSERDVCISRDTPDCSLHTLAHDKPPAGVLTSKYIDLTATRVISRAPESSARVYT